MRKGSKHSMATRLQMSKAKKGKPSPKRGCHLSEETKIKLRLANLGKKHSEYTKRKISRISRKHASDPAWRKRVSLGTKKAFLDPQKRLNVKIGNLNARRFNPNWKGGVTYKQNGYKLIFNPGHPNCGKAGYVMEHRLVMSNHLGRPLSQEEVVHHIDHDITNNSIENLQLFKNKSEHRKHHALTKH